MLVQAVRHSTALHELLLHYARIFMIQVAQTALSNGNDAIVERLARWLLMCNDRIDGDIPMTHNFLSIMLGVRRASVSGNLRTLESDKIIRSKHGRIEVRDRAALERLAGVSYGLNTRHLSKPRPRRNCGRDWTRSRMPMLKDAANENL